MGLFIYKPLDWAGVKVDMDCCRQSVTHVGGWQQKQCSKRATIFIDHNGERIGLCKIHSPEVMEKRAQESEQRYRDYVNRCDERIAYDILRTQALEALREIARGHKDPRTLACDTLQQYGDTQWQDGMLID
jgi:hypothetical protein